MKTKKVDKKKTLAYAVAFYFTDVSVKFMMGNAMYEYVHTVYDRRYDNGGFNTLAVVYNYKRMKYEVLVVSDEKVGDKEIHILYCLLYTSPSPRDRQKSRMPSSA